ncbi:MAG TPA: SIMPL domain-containing protein [Dermatophilaceae bacterium]|jgi:uncharacterized protein YggE|nr:SIMPL domain-containing protein [Actinomycetales bacterium]HMT31827.1 SIMPL domain-containing protein [Dermatophilaceae bacterium]HMT88771.1 SIMPL domain-containing protein [Dermatophilaceae bacterium]
MTSPNEHRPRPARVEVSGSGSASATPDVVRLALGIRCDADGVAAALTSAAGVLRAVSAAARAHGVADRDIASQSASVQPRWDKDGTAVVGYTAYHSVAVHVRALGDLNALVDAVAAAAGNSLVIDGISLDLSDRAPLEVTAREAAFAAAKAKAQQYAVLSGASLGRVLAVTEGAVGFGGGPMREVRYAMASADSGGMPVEAGEHTVTATVSVSWELVPE